jgi:hypothetical protein
MTACVRCAAAIAFLTWSEYSRTVQSLFKVILQHLNEHGFIYFRYALKFLTFGIVQHGLPLEMLVSKFEKLGSMPLSFEVKMIKALTITIQCTDAQSLGLRICHFLCHLKSPIINVLGSLVVFAHFPLQNLNYLLPDIDISELARSDAEESL